MATRNIVPRATGEGQIGTSAKTWSAGYFNDIAVTNGVTASTFTGDLTGDVTGDVTGNVTGDVTGNADTATSATNATNDANGNNIATTYLPAVVGAVMAFAGSTSPAGWLLCDGSAVSRTDYAALFAVIGTTYGTGDGSTTFNLPNLVDKFIQGNATSGTVKTAGLPNITGKIANSAWLWKGSTGTPTLTGAFKNMNVSSNGWVGNSSENGNAYFGFEFDASSSSSIYGNSTTVQPPAVTMRYIIKY